MDLSMTALGHLRAITVLWAMNYVLVNPLFIMYDASFMAKQHRYVK